MTTLTVATWNIGNGDLDDARRILKHDTAALALQEASDRDPLLDRLERAGYAAIRPDRQAGQAATPLIYDPARLLLIRPDTQLVAPGRQVNRGTGPERMKPKWLIGGRFIDRDTRRRVAIYSTHRVSGQTRDRDTIRDQVAEQHARNVVNHLDRYQGIPIVAGDWNSLPDDDSLAPLRRHGWTSDQLRGARRPTHGGWTPDHVWWRQQHPHGHRDHRVDYVLHRTLDTSSDHRALLATFDLTRRPR